MLLAAKGLFAKSLYEIGLTHHDVASIRAVLAVPGFALLAWMYRGKGGATPLSSIRPRHWLLAAFAGLLCYYLGALANFYALTIIPANVERPLLFAYPVFVVLINTALTRQAPNSRVVFALILTSIGVVLVTGSLNRSLSAAEWSGMAWVMFCSLTIALYFLLSGYLTQRLGSGLFTLVAMTSAAAGFLIHYQLIQGWLSVDLAPDAWWILIGLVIFSTVLPLFLVAEGVRRVGASQGALISTLGPPATALMAFQLNGETLTNAQILGIVVVVMGVLALESGRIRRA